MSDSQPNAREEVFCHSCGELWERNEHGLICPNCESEFVEIQENGTQSPLSPESTSDPNPFSQGFLSPGGPQQFFPRNEQTGTSANRFMGGIFGLLQQMASMPSQQQQQQQNDTGNMRSFSYSTPSGSTRISFRSTSIGPGGINHGNQSPHLPHGHPFQGLFGDSFRPPGSPPSDPNMTMPMPQLFNLLFELGNGQRSGDVVWSQEEMDRIMSQLMEQGRSAPGPATANAIEELPKISIDKSMMEDGKAECTICMDEVNLGDIVTQLYCKHWFHTQCITVWLREHDTCPHCRKSIEESKKEVEEKNPSSSSSSNKPTKPTRRSSSTNSVPTQTQPNSSSSRNFPRRSSYNRSSLQNDHAFDSTPNLTGRSPRPYPPLNSPFDQSTSSLHQGSYPPSLSLRSSRRTSASPTTDRFTHYHNTSSNGYMEPTNHRTFENNPYRRRSEIPETWETDFERELLRDEQRRASERRFLERHVSERDRRSNRRESNGDRRSSSYIGSGRDRDRDREREHGHRSGEHDNTNESRGIFDRMRDMWRGPSQH